MGELILGKRVKISQARLGFPSNWTLMWKVWMKRPRDNRIFCTYREALRYALQEKKP